MAPDLDCRACGLCCTSDIMPYEGIATVQTDDLPRMSRRVRLQLVDGYTPAVWRYDLDMATCGFLRGTPGKACSCRIYDSRPRVCRNFKPGSRSCLAVRKILPAL